jgi:tetratricopeptide (TPR) repeat protein
MDYMKHENKRGFATPLINLPGKVINSITSRKMGIAACVALLLFSFAIPHANADVRAKQETVKEAVLKQVSRLIETDQTNRENMAKAISVLNANSPVLRDDIRFPLFLAQAYYLSIDPNEDIDKGFPYYKKTGLYARKALDMDATRAEGHYWYGLYLLKKAQKAGGISAYFIVKRAIRELELVRKSMPEYDHGGASRVLGLLYYIAPGWSPFGDIDKSIRLAQEAKRIDPSYPLNVLYLADAFNKKGERGAALREYRALLALCSAAGSGRQGAMFSEKARTMIAALENNTNQ